MPCYHYWEHTEMRTDGNTGEVASSSTLSCIAIKSNLTNLSKKGIIAWRNHIIRINVAIHSNKWTSSWQVCCYFSWKKQTIVNILKWLKSLHNNNPTLFLSIFTLEILGWWRRDKLAVRLWICTSMQLKNHGHTTISYNRPGPGRNPLKASSALIRHSIECPLSTISSCR